MTTRAVGSPSVASDIANHDLVLTFWGGTDHHPVVEARIPIEHVLAFAASVVNEARNTLSDVIGDIATGHCDQCRNTRLIHVPRRHGGGTEAVRCPGCADRLTSTADALARAPRVRPSGFCEDQP